MQLERFPDSQAVAGRAAELVAGVLTARRDAVLLLPAGTTPVPLYAELVRRARSRALDLSHAHLFQLDELVGVAPADERSFHAFFAKHLVEPLGLAARFHGLDGRAGDPGAEIERHRRALEHRGPADLALLGLGRNGHLAFNEPGARLSDAARMVELDPVTRQGLAGVFPNDRPSHGLTLGLREIAAAKRIVLIVTGTAKAEMLSLVLSGSNGSERPAALLADHPRTVVLADEAACGVERG